MNTFWESLRERIDRHNLKTYFGLYVGLFLIYRFVPENITVLRSLVSDVMLVDLAIITYVGWRKLFS